MRKRGHGRTGSVLVCADPYTADGERLVAACDLGIANAADELAKFDSILGLRERESACSLWGR
jgi:hypothetical protein